jgi:hypothetical protein
MIKGFMQNGAVRTGLNWGAIGGIAGFFSGLLGALSAMLIAGFIGYYCGKRASATVAERRSGKGAFAGFLAGCIAAPVFLVGAAVGAIVSAQSVGMDQFARSLSEFEFLGGGITPEEAWLYFLLSLIFGAFAQAAVLVSFAVLGGAWTIRREEARRQ